MSFLLELSRFLKAEAWAEKGALAGDEFLHTASTLTAYERDFPSTTLVDKEQKAINMTSLFLILFVSLFLLTFLGFMIARRNNKRLLNNEGEGHDEEQQLLTSETVGPNSGTDLAVFQQNQFEIESNTSHHHQSNILFGKCYIGMNFAFINFLVEIPSAVIDQIASENKHNYVLIVMILSFTSMLVCLIELVSKGRRKKVAWKWSSGKIPWFYYPGISRPFGTLIDMIGMSCAIAQCIVTTINYSFLRRNHAAPIKLSVWPVIFAFGVLCSKFMENEGETEMCQDGDDDAIDLNNETNFEQPLTPTQLQ